MNLQNTVGGWLRYGFSAKRAVHDLVAIHLAYQNARGKGNRARRRIAAIAKRQNPVRDAQGHARVWVLPGTGLT